MHLGAKAFVARALPALQPVSRVLEVGSRNINGTVRDLFPAVDLYHGIDLHPGLGVDEVADVFAFDPGDMTFDCVVCCETLEHMDPAQQPVFVARLVDLLETGGVLILTAACEPRAPHSHIDGCQLRPGEAYGNVPHEALRTWLDEAGAPLRVLDGDPVHGDVYAVALKR